MEDSKIILIDYSAIAISNVMTQKLDIEEGMVRHMILNSLRRHRVKYREKYGELVLCIDGSKNWRKEFYPQYKFKRKRARKESKVDMAEAYRIIDMVKEEIKEVFPYRVVEVDEVEADDIVGTLCDYTQEFGRHEEIMIISGDKDFAQLQKYNNVSQYSPVLGKFIKEPAPRKQLMELIIRGDTGDSVPNVLSGDNVFVDDIRQTPVRQKKVDELINDPKSLGEEVYRNYQRNKKLVDLTETPETLKKKIIYNYEHQDNLGNKNKVFPYLVEKRCRRLLEDVKDFI